MAGVEGKGQAVADVQTGCAAALAAYDPPTKAELDTGLAALNDVSSADVQTAAAAALTAYDPPTKAELDTAQAAVQADIAALNDLSAAQVNAECDTALADYDPPTKAELDTAQAAIIAEVDANESKIDDITDVVTNGSGTHVATNKSLIDVLGFTGADWVSHEFAETNLAGWLYGQHSIACILFAIPEAVGSINAHNSAIRTRIQKIGHTITVTQADLATVDFEGLTCVVLGTDNGTAWTTSNLANLKSHPIPVLCCDSTTAAYMEIGTDGGDAASKTVANAISTIEGSILGVGDGNYTGLAAGANTVADSGVTFNTLDMSDADLSEDWYAYETTNNNTDVLIGEVKRIRRDGNIGTDEDGEPVAKTIAFYGCAYSFNGLNTLGQDVLSLLVHRIVHEQKVGKQLILAGTVSALENRLLGNMKTSFNAASPFVEYIAGTDSVGTKLPTGVSIYDVFGGFSGDGGAAQDDSIKASLDLAHTDLDAILTDTAEIGAAGAGLTAVPWNAAWDAEVQSECADALAAYDPPTKAEMDTAHALLATVAKQNRILCSMDFWSDIDDSIAVDATAGDENLPNITVADLPSGATVVRAIMMFKCRAIADSSSAENYVESAQVMSIDSDSGRGSVVTAINIPANMFKVAADTKEGGDVIIGDNDVASEVTGNATYYPTWELADAHGGSLTFYDVQVGLRIWYSL